MLLLAMFSALSVAGEPDDPEDRAGVRLVADVGIAARVSSPGQVGEVPIGVEAGWQGGRPALASPLWVSEWSSRGL